MELEEYVKQVREQADAYERTIQTIISFDSAVRWDDNKKTYFGHSYFLPCRRLSKSLSLPNDVVTPDIVIQISNNYGIVAEVKITASNEQDFTKAHEQIQNYDNDLIGWKTNNEKIDSHDLSLLVNDFKKNIAHRYFKDKIFKRKFTLVACAIIVESKAFCKIEKYYGVFSDERIESKLSNPVPVSLEPIIGIISSVKFYDTEPPVEYTMNVLWMNVFNEIKQGGGVWGTEKMISVDCKEVTRMLQEKYSFKQIDSRQPKIPREAWIRDALDEFVAIKYAQKDSDNGEKYYVKYSYPRKDDMLGLFSKKHFEVLNKKTLKGKQLKFDFKTNQ
jgi:hypothetical protein